MSDNGYLVKTLYGIAFGVVCFVVFVTEGTRWSAASDRADYAEWVADCRAAEGSVVELGSEALCRLNGETVDEAWIP